jgi:hypothetical protein
MAARKEQAKDTERTFIFMATDLPLGNVTDSAGGAAVVLSSDEALYHIQGAMGNKGISAGIRHRIGEQRQRR